MCLAAFAIHASARWPLVIASNRDEFFDRPALPLAEWRSSEGQTIISGRDARAGGTWLGLTPSGRIALLTNAREQPAPQAVKSRGELTMRWLQGDMDAGQFMRQIDGTAYGGFNLVLGDVSTGQWHCLSNRPQSGGLHSQHMLDGIYGLSNAALDTPWPKTLALKTAMLEALNTESEIPVWQALASRNRSATGDLSVMGLPSAFEAALSSAFVYAPDQGYGTRCSTLLVARAAGATHDKQNWHVQITEKTHAMGQTAPESTGAIQTHNLTLQGPNRALQFCQ